MIQSLYLFSETSIQIHEYGHSERFSGGNTRWWFEGPVFSWAWRLPTPTLPLCLAHLTHFAVPRFILYNNVRSIFEWSSWVWSSDLLSYWTWSGVMEIASFRHFVKSGVTQDNMTGFWTEDSSEPSTYTICTNSLDLLSRVKSPCWTPSGCLEECMVFMLLLLSHFSHVWHVRPHRWQPTGLLCTWGSPGKNTGVGHHFLLQMACCF